MKRPLQTTVSAMQRTITVLYSNGVDERYALFRSHRGDVHWRLDEFRAPEHPGQEPRWVACHGRVSVADVIDRLPDQAHTAVDWTRNEIELGTVVTDDIFSAMRREEALARLQAELDAALGVDPQAA